MPGEIEELSDGGLILGAFDFASYSSSALQLNQGDILVIYSDCLTDMENPNEERYYTIPLALSNLTPSPHSQLNAVQGSFPD